MSCPRAMPFGETEAPGARHCRDRHPLPPASPKASSGSAAAVNPTQASNPHPEFGDRGGTHAGKRLGSERARLSCCVARARHRPRQSLYAAREGKGRCPPADPPRSASIRRGERVGRKLSQCLRTCIGARSALATGVLAIWPSLGFVGLDERDKMSALILGYKVLVEREAEFICHGDPRARP